MTGSQSTSKSLRNLLIALSTLLLAVTMSMIAVSRAGAVNGTDWLTVANAIDGYVTSQYDPGADGEAGFLITGAALKAQIDSSNSGAVLGEGDDAASAPVLVDVYPAGANWIPGTSLRAAYTTAATKTNADKIALQVENHRQAGFSTDVVLYCATGHTEAPPTMAYGAMAQAGYFGSPAPKVKALKWGRLGWNSTGISAPNYSYTGSTSASAAVAGSNPLPGSTACNGTAPASELVRCAADAGLAGMSTGVTGPWSAASEGGNQPIDLRASLTGGTIGLPSANGAAYAVQDPLQTLFSSSGGHSNLKKLDPTKSVVFFNRTQHTAGMAAQGARMLGYNATFYRWGMPMWNGGASPGWQEKYAGANPGYGVTTTIDTVAPSVLSVASGVPGTTSATITWGTSEPATSKVQYGTISGSLTSVTNDTVLHAAHSVSLTGLAPDTTYYYVVKSYDGSANGSASAEKSFKTAQAPPADTTPPVVTNVEPSGNIPFNTANVVVSANYSDGGSGIDAGSVAVTLDGTPLTNCNVTYIQVSCPYPYPPEGVHTIGGSVADRAGNRSPITGSFTVDPRPPDPEPEPEPEPAKPAFDVSQYGLENDMLYIANGRASNVAVLDVAKMRVVDYIPVPRAPINAAAAGGQLGATLTQAIRGNGLFVPGQVHDMFYWEIHGVVPSQDRGSVYAVGALSFTPSDWTMYQVNTKTKQNEREIPMAISPVGYCGIEYDRNDESSNMLYALSMQTGPADLAQLSGLPLQLKDPVDRLLVGLGLGGLVNSVEDQLAPVMGGISESNIDSGTNTGFIATDYNANGSSSTCGIAWNADGSRAFASQMFEPLIDTLNWNTKKLDGEIIPPSPYVQTTQHQSTSAKTRGLLFTANGIDGVAVYDMNLNTLVGRIDINSLIGHATGVHGVEVSPSNENVIYVVGDAGSAGMYVVDVSNIRAPKLLSGLEGLDPAACGVYAISDKDNYYRESGKCSKPDLSVAKTGAYWESYADYQARQLSVSFSINLNGTTEANDVTITNTVNTNGVTTVTPMPIMVGDVTSAASGNLTIKYDVPTGTSTFRTSLEASATSPCGDVYIYPAMNGVDVPPEPAQDPTP